MTESIVTASVNSVIAVFVLLLLDVEMLIYSYVNFYYFNGLYTLYFSFWVKQTLVFICHLIVWGILPESWAGSSPPWEAGGITLSDCGITLRWAG